MRALALVLLLAGCGGEPALRRPNVLVLSIDTLRADHLGCYGYERPTSPRIDALADRGVLFESARAPSSWTLPTMTTALTSFEASTHGTTHFTKRLSDGFETLPERLRDAGYDTAGFSTNFLFSRRYGLRQGFIHFDETLARSSDPERLETGEPLADRGVQWIRWKAESSDDAPWLLWLHFFDPHWEYVPHEGITERFGTERVDLYDGEVAFTDLQVGRVLDALEEGGLADDTIVVLFSDHGEEFEDHGMTLHGHTLFGELVRVPLIVRAPGFTPRRVAGNVGLVDLLPTLIELVGLAPPPTAGGRSLVPAMRGATLPERATLLELHRATRPLSGLVEGPWKLIRATNPPEETLFHLGDDPGETADRRASDADVGDRMSARLDAELARSRRRAAGFSAETDVGLLPGDVQRIEDLGYAGDR